MNVVIHVINKSYTETERWDKSYSESNISATVNIIVQKYCPIINYTTKIEVHRTIK